MSARAASVLALAMSWTCAASVAHAHPTPGSVAMLDFTVDGARIEQNVPIEELERALHQTLAGDGETADSIVAHHEALLREYAAAHVQARSAGGAAWTTTATRVTGIAADDGPRALFSIALRAPPGEASSSLELHDDVVAHEVISHYTTVYVRSDWANGTTPTSPRLAGIVHAGRIDVSIARSGSFWRGFRGVIGLGVEHIETGTDHLMFLFALLLVAPVAAVSGKWSQRRRTPETLLALARVVTAFTIGHSLTLALGTVGGVTLPTTLVEAGIALSILITALHALKPLFPNREPLLAATFGLIHGLAFASSLPQRDLGAAQAAWTLLGFNLGIELAQLELLFAVAPWVLILARTRAYDWFRIAGGSVAAVLSVAWLAERTLNVANPFARPITWLETHPLQLLIALASFALIVRAAERRLPKATVTAPR